MRLVLLINFITEAVFIGAAIFLEARLNSQTNHTITLYHGDPYLYRLKEFSELWCCHHTTVLHTLCTSLISKVLLYDKAQIISRMVYIFSKFIDFAKVLRTNRARINLHGDKFRRQYLIFIPKTIH